MTWIVASPYAITTCLHENNPFGYLSIIGHLGKEYKQVLYCKESFNVIDSIEHLRALTALVSGVLS